MLKVIAILLAILGALGLMMGFVFFGEILGLVGLSATMLSGIGIQIVVKML